MTSSIVDADVVEAVDELRAAVDRISALDLDSVAASDLVSLLQAHETEHRRVTAVAVDLVDSIERRGLHALDGHHSAKIMARHLLRLSNTEAAGRARAAKALRELPTTRTAFRSGRVGFCQVKRLARAHANSRARAALVEVDEQFATVAENTSYKRFDEHVGDFVRRVDEDGTCDTNQVNHDNRDARLIQNYDLSWSLSAGCASLQGAALHNIFEQFVQAELEADWDKARAEHGDHACAEQLPRSDNQRRFDALWNIFRQGAQSGPDGVNSGTAITTNLILDHRTFERMTNKLAGLAPEPVEPGDALDGSFRCSTIDGHRVEPTEATHAALAGHIRRVVLGADSVVIDLGRRQRLFTGSARLAVMLQTDECFWPGCHVPVSRCQADHTKPAAQGGCTCPANGAPACGRHNRLKERHYTVWRDPTGAWHTYRPDGSEI